MNEISPTHPTTNPNPQPQTSAPQSKHEGLKNVLSTVGVIVLAPLIAICLTAFVFQSYEVYGPSMQQTLQNQDRLIIYKLPKTWARLTHRAYVPKRGDIIVFSRDSSSQYNGTEEKQLIKRVIGVPGDHVVVRDGRVTVYNYDHPAGFNPDVDLPHSKGIPATSGTVDVTVAEKQVFVMGDNRPNSLDSRVFGPISTDQIVGKLVLRIYPFGEFDSF